MEKICSTCGKNKSLDLYHRDVSKSDGYRNNCKKCSSVSKGYEENIENVREKMCNVCKLVKPLEEFLRDERTTLGFGKKCIECASKKLCRSCQTKKHVSEFPTDTTTSTDGYRSRCKQCENELLREKYKNNPEWRNRILRNNQKYFHKKDSREGRRERMLLKNYGITLEDYENLLIKQNSCCGICKSLPGERGRTYLVVDHNHETGEIRGLLCDPCNRALGMFKDSIEILINAISYIFAEDKPVFKDGVDINQILSYLLNPASQMFGRFG